MSGALEGQRRLVREVHHRVKNNLLQVVASLLNIHGRSAETARLAPLMPASADASGPSIVHRNHFAEMEENRGSRSGPSSLNLPRSCAQERQRRRET